MKHKITNFKVHGSGNNSQDGISGFEITLTNGEESGLIGKVGYSNPTTKDLPFPLIDGLKTIRYDYSGAGNKFGITQLEFKSDSETKIVTFYNKRQWHSFNLEPNETIVGIYGEQFDDPSYAHRFRTFGFIIGKLV